MTNYDDLLAAAVIDQINAEMGASGLTMKDMASRLERPYDSTRNYLKKERSIPFNVIVEMCTALNILPEELIKRARQRIA